MLARQLWRAAVRSVGVRPCVVTTGTGWFQFNKLVYQPVPLHGLEIVNNYNYLSYALIHLLHILIKCNRSVRIFFRSISPPYVFDLYLIEHCILSYEQYKILALLSVSHS
jgi:hypothetical protein